MGLRLKSQIILILFLPMALVIILMSYFNISILQNTLILSTSQLTSSMAEHIFIGIYNLITEGGTAGPRLSLINPANASNIDSFVKDFEDLKSLKIISLDNRELYSYGESGFELESRRALLNETRDTKKRTSHLWAYGDPADRSGGPISTIRLIDSRVLSYEYMMPLLEGSELIGVMYISFYVKKLPRLVTLISLGNIILVFIFLLSLFIGLSIWCDNAIKRPLEFMHQAQEKLAKGDFDIRVNLDMVQTNELARAYGSFNRMAEDLKIFREELERKNVRLGELNQQYRELNERLELEVADKTKELREFFSLITHDLKVPLAASQGYTDLLLKSKTGVLNEKQRKFLQSISMANSYLLHLVRNMLDSVKYDAGKINYFMESFPLPGLVEEVGSNLHLFLEEKEITLEVNIPEECETVYADRMKIMQVLTNLLSNAIEMSSPKEKIALTASEYLEMVEISIVDHGPGINSEHLETIFDKFTQFPYEVKSRGGLGLGLYIVKKILDGHGQQIRVVSEPGQGSMFIFTLPKEKPQSQKEGIG